MNPAYGLASLPLRWKVLGSLFIVAALFIGALLFVGAQYVGTVQPAGGALLEALARERSTTLQVIVNGITANLRSLVENPLLQDAYALLATGAAAVQDERRLVEDVFQNLLANNLTYRQVRFVSVGGRTLAATPAQPRVNESEQPYFGFLQRDLTFRGTFISPITQRGNDFELEFATIVRRSGRPIGYLVINVDPTGRNTPGQPSILTALRPLNVPAGVLGFYLIASDGRLDTLGEATAELSDEQRARARALATQTFTEPISYISPVTNRVVRGFGVPVRGMDRVLVAEVQVLLTGRADEAGRFLAELSLVGLLGLGVLALLALFLDWSVVRPLRSLSQAAQLAAQGRNVAQPPVKQRDEIGIVAAALPALSNLSQQDVAALEKRLARRAQEVELTRAIGQTLFNLRDTDRLMRRVVELVCESFPQIDNVHIFALDSASQTLILRIAMAQTGESPLPQGYRVGVSPRSVIGRAAQSEQITLQLFDESSPNELLSRTRAELALPLRTHAGLFGVLDLHSHRAETFDDEAISFFKAVADQIAVALTNAQLFEESQARLAEIEDLNRRMLGEAWRGYEVARRRAMPRRGFTAPEPDLEWSELQLRAYYSGELQERIEAETVTFAVPVSLRGQCFGAVEWTVPRATYNENMRLLARELAARLAVNADNARLLEQSQRLAERERLVNTITERLSRQTSVEQVLQVAIRELGQALRLPQTSIQLAAQIASESVEESEESYERNVE